ALYLETGSIFWPDSYWLDPFSILWSIVDHHEPLLSAGSETGQLLVNKAVHRVSLAVASYFNTEGGMIYHKFATYGDNDLWRMGWLAMGKNYSQVEHLPDDIGYLSSVDGETFCGTARLQKHPRSGEPLFLHLGSYKLSEHLGKEFPLKSAIKVIPVKPHPKRYE
ncbi:unnamed protein product, partial [Polarella glacialis]